MKHRPPANCLAVRLSILLITVGFTQSAFAKVGDPLPELFGKWVFTSHSHQVTAYEQKPGENARYCLMTRDCKQLWSIELPLPEYRNQFTPPDPTLERDVQWCRIEKAEMRDGLLRVFGCDQRIFLLNPANGEIISH
jgi:hypothetical protein